MSLTCLTARSPLRCHTRENISAPTHSRSPLYGSCLNCFPEKKKTSKVGAQTWPPLCNTLRTPSRAVPPASPPPSPPSCRVPDFCWHFWRWEENKKSKTMIAREKDKRESRQAAEIHAGEGKGYTGVWCLRQREMVEKWSEAVLKRFIQVVFVCVQATSARDATIT